MLLLFYTSLLIILTHITSFLFLFISLELLNLGLLSFIIYLNLGFYYVFFVLLIQVCEAILMMSFFLKSIPLWENFNNWLMI